MDLAYRHSQLEYKKQLDRLKKKTPDSYSAQHECETAAKLVSYSAQHECETAAKLMSYSAQHECETAAKLVSYSAQHECETAAKLQCRIQSSMSVKQRRNYSVVFSPA